MKLLNKHMMENVSGAGNQDIIDNIKFINDLVLTVAIGTATAPAAPVMEAVYLLQARENRARISAD
ncbi:hypothetical protein ACISK3_01185 [Morganella morganii]|nr:hypothetical protein [Morganella morganii]